MYQQNHVDFDVLIAGGGLVGSMLACLLGNTPLRVGLLEAASPAAEPQHGYDVRVSAITLATRAVFEATGVWPLITARRLAAIREMQVWDSGGEGCVHFDCADIGEAEMGYIIENSVMLGALEARLQRLSNIKVLRPFTVEAVTWNDGHVMASDGQGQTLSARLLVAADGARSRIRDLADIGIQGWDLRQTGIVATVETALPHQDTARQVFLPTGPLALLPLGDARHCSIVWSADTARAEQLMAMDEAAFTAELQAAFGDRLGAITLAGDRAAFPLTLAHAERYVIPRLALIGDAAHRVHPLAGQGLNLGIMDAATLAEVLLTAVGRNKDVGDMAVLRGFERWRKADNLAMLAVTDGFKRLFGNTHPLVSSLRNIGLSVTNRLAPLRNKIMRVAAGLEGDLPRVARRS